MLTVGIDSYITVAAADDLITACHHDTLSDKWLGLTEHDKEIHLRNATYRIDCLNFKGYRHSHTQQLEFPRGMSTGIPLKVQLAVAEEALAAIDTQLLQRCTLQQQGVTSVTLGSASESYSDSAVAGKQNCPLLSQIAYNYLRQYIAATAVIV